MVDKNEEKEEQRKDNEKEKEVLMSQEQKP
jgi:hypothetical protein